MSTQTNAVENGTVGATQGRREVDMGHQSPMTAVRRKLTTRVAALAMVVAALLIALGCGANLVRGRSAGAPGRSAVPVQILSTPTTCEEGRGQMAPIGSACLGDVLLDEPIQGAAADPLAIAGATGQ